MSPDCRNPMHKQAPMTRTTVEQSFCTTRQAALLLGVSVGTVQLWVESGLLQAWKTAGGHRRVIRDSVERLLRKAAPDAAAPDSPPEIPRLSVLVVEDDVHILRLYQANLASWPMHPEVKFIDNAIAALMEIGRSRPDLLITDLNMPGMDGFRMLRVLRQTPEMTLCKIVAVTGLDAAEIEQRGGVPAGVEVLPKPIPFHRLLDIATALAHPVRAQSSR